MPHLRDIDLMTERYAHTSSQGLFVTGLYRSGTTLLEKLLSAHSDIALASQPMAPLFYAPKAAFHDSLGLRRRYPLDHLFRERAYGRRQFEAFLSAYSFDRSALQAVVDRSKASNQAFWSPDVERIATRLPARDFTTTLRHWLALPARRYARPRATFAGCKEIVCEEYLPWLLRHGIRVVLIVRDPRDVVTSSNYGRGNDFTGRLRPTLFTLRAWRKSVAYWIACEGDPLFLAVRYEDLIASPSETLARVAAFLAIRPFPSDFAEKGLFDQDGNPWMGNSSFEDRRGVVRPLGNWSERLPHEVVAFIESSCRPEMDYLGYRAEATTAFDPGAIRGYREPYRIDHDMFDPGYSCRVDHTDEEIRRNALLQPGAESLDGEQAEEWFIHARAYERLREICGRGLSSNGGSE